MIPAMAGEGYGPVDVAMPLHAHTDPDGEWHIYPDDEDHIPSSGCPCQPIRSARTWLHWAKVQTTGGDCCAEAS